MWWIQPLSNNQTFHPWHLICICKSQQNDQTHYRDVTMSAIASPITSFTIAYLPVYPAADQRKHQISALLAFVRGIHRLPVNSPHKGPVTRKMFPLDDVIMKIFKINLTFIFYVLAFSRHYLPAFHGHKKPMFIIIIEIWMHLLKITLFYWFTKWSICVHVYDPRMKYVICNVQ